MLFRSLHKRANGWPQTVVGPDGHQISLATIRSALQEYEWITETSYQLIEVSTSSLLLLPAPAIDVSIQAALPINVTLKCYTAELQNLFN